MEGYEILIPLTLFAGLFTTIIVGMIVSNRRKKFAIQSKAEVYNRMLDKFGSSREFADFLQTAEGRSFLDSFGRESVSPSLPLLKILGSVKVGIVLLLLGLALIGLSFWTAQGDVEQGPMTAGVLLVSVGLGFLITAFVSYRLSKAWGLLPGNEPDRNLPAAA